MKIVIERGKKRYEMIPLRDISECSKSCSYAKRDSDSGHCEHKCYLPKWFNEVEDLIRDNGAVLREIA